MFGRDRSKQSVVVAPRDSIQYSAGQAAPAPAAGSSLAAEIDRLSALTLAALAAEVMQKVIGLPGAQGGPPVELENAARQLVYDVVGDEVAVDPGADPRLRDLVGEGLQMLEQARLVRLDGWSQGQFFHVGYAPTRAGRAALEQGTVEGILAGAN